MACAVEMGGWVGGGGVEPAVGLDLETTSSSSCGGSSGGEASSAGGSGEADKEGFRPWAAPASPLPPPPPPPPPSTSSSRAGGGRGQRNYKNMTRERRMEANARERSRVHTISAAFETLRKAVPAYSHNQKLSKLSVLRVAASYILTLSRVLGEDYSLDRSSPSIAQCVENVTNTIQMEGKLRKRKED